MRRVASSALACCALSLAALPAAAGAARQATWEAALFYQFQSALLPDSEGITVGRIEYVLDGKTLRTQHVVFRPDADGIATFVLPDPEAVAGPGTDNGLRIDVYAADTRVESFDLASLREYNRRLKVQDGARLEAVFAARPADEPPSTKVGEERRRNVAESAAAAPPQALDGCEQACIQEHRACLRDCQLSGNCSSCEAELLQCRAGCPNGDGDGVVNSQDNCPLRTNPGQADCDNDGSGDVCDSQNARYQVVRPDKTCMTDRDSHGVYFTFEHHVELLERDVSSCGAPDRWRRRIRQDNDCFNISDFDCCIGLRYSIAAVGDDPMYWCHHTIRDRNFCH